MRTRRIAIWSAVAIIVTSIALLVALASAVWWSLRSERGSAWLVGALPGVHADAPRGTLIGDFGAAKLVITLPGTTLTLTDVQWRGLSVARSASPRWAAIRIDSLAANRVDVVSAPNPTPSAAPTDLQLPITLELRALDVAELYTPLTAVPLRTLHAALTLGDEHRIDALSFAWDRLQASGELRIGAAAPMPLVAALRLTQQAADTLPAWRASATLAGPLAAPVLQATLRAAATGDRPEQALDANATLHPFAAWPLGELRASVTALDLAAFSSAAPATALSGSAVATTRAVDKPATVTLALSNAIAGRWNDARLPLRRLDAELAGRPDQPNALTLTRLAAELGNGQNAAGRIAGTGHWSPSAWSLAATLDDVRPAQLDARAPAMRLSGPLMLNGATAIDLKTELAGRLDGLTPARDVKLIAAATLAADRVELRDVQALAAGARAQLSGSIVRTATDSPWSIQAKATLVDFDPALWWPGRDDSPWRRARHRLNASADAALTLPSVKPTLDTLRGQATLALKPSELAGVPLAGTASWRDGTAAVDLLADTNRVRANGRIDAWDLEVAAPALARLAPIYRLFAAGDPAFAGALTANGRLTGRWPALTTEGRFDANALQVGALGIRNAQGRWSLASSASAPVDAQVDASGVTGALGTTGPPIDTLQLRLKGTGRAHTLEVRANSVARPPAWIDAVQAAPASTASAPTSALLLAQGGLVDLAGAPLGGWRGSILQLELRGAAPLVQARDVGLEAAWSDTPRVTLQPGRADVLGGVVRWSRVNWQAAGSRGAAQIDAEAEVEPLRIAPLLARAQPEFGWGGDLSAAAHLKLHTSAVGFTADVVIERAGGDLSVTDELGTRALGLTDLRLGLAVDNGVWNFTQGLAGKTVGVAAGAVVVRTRPEAIWPPADAPIQGVLELQVADLGTWGTWAPPGWRVAGALRASAGINGRFGAPEYTGEVTGSKIGVRNFVQGVNVSDGDVAIRLEGARARIERFTAKAGDGSIRLEGSASLGDAPKAELQLSADKFQLLGRVDRRIVASGQGRLQLDAKSLALAGEFGVDEGLIDFTRSDAPALSDDVEVVRTKPDAAPVAPTPASPSRAVTLDLRVALGDRLRVRGRGLDTGLAGELRITAPGGRLAVNGTVRAVDGTYAAYGQKLSIDKGLITFNGPVENPRLDIEATRPNIDMRVGVAVGGVATNPRIRLFSEPELSEIDKLSWLVMGRASDGLGRTDTALLQRAAIALLAGEGPGLTDQLTKAIGLDDIGVRQTDGEVRETVISLGKQLSRRWYVGYERGLNATTGNFQLIYRIAQRFTLRAQSGEDSSLDLIWTWRWK